MPGGIVEPIPGPTAILAALVASGLPPYPFTFAGFPPPKSGKRRTFYKTWAPLGHTLVYFESPTASYPAWRTPSPRWETARPPSAGS
jgi:16S rRNA (cytidine1402-2'-O)-methyltransferase